ncbi:MAG: hypothetical protein AB9828_00980 [Sphaerochaetaceae bacterium]
MKKMYLMIGLLWVATSLAFALDTPKTLLLETSVAAQSALTVNGGTGTTYIIEPASFGSAVTIPYTYVGNQLVSLTVTSTNSMQLHHTDYATYGWHIPYTMTLDYGDNVQTAVTSGSPVAMVDDNGVYDLERNMQITVTAGTYAAGTYADTLTFTITTLT